MALNATARVLIADSDPGLRLQLSKRLYDAEIFADSVANGGEALVKLRERDYSVILLDLALPQIGAEETLQFLRDLPPLERPVVLVLANGTDAQSLDVDLVQVVLRKPCSIPHLADIISSCVKISAEYGRSDQTNRLTAAESSSA